MSLLPVASLEEAIQAANSERFGLCCAIYTRDLTRAFRVMDWLGAGITSVNAPTSDAETHLPFGGIHPGGTGSHTGGRQGLDVYTAWKTVYIEYSGGQEQP